MSPSSALQRALDDEARRWRAAGLERGSFSSVRGGGDFTSNDYLGLSSHPDVIEAAREALLAWGAGGRSARLLGGGSPAHARAEELCARWLGEERALLFPSGYQANLGVIGALLGPGDLVLSDALNHASLIDAVRLSRARVAVYRHADLGEVEHLLRTRGERGRCVLVTESVFGMDGDLAPLAGLERLCLEHGATMIVDEAHAAGLLGPRGEGGWAVRSRDPVESSEALAARVITGSKALGVGGGFVVGSAAVVEHVRQRARSFVFTTAPPPPTAAALVRAIEKLQDAQLERQHCLDAARRIAAALGLPAPDCAIVPVVIGEPEAAMQAAAMLRERGLEVRAVRPPTVPVGTARLRLVTHAANNAEDVDRLIEALKEVAPPRPRSTATAPEQAAPRPLAHPLFVVGTDTGVGKTVVSALLVRAAARRGEVAYLKPVQTGGDDDTAEVARLSGRSRSPWDSPTRQYPLPASPHEAAAAAGHRLDPDELDRALEGARDRTGDGVLLVELAGGLMVPLTPDWTQLDWLARRRADCVLVARSGLGTLNHTLLSLEALRHRHLRPRAVFLVGPEHPSNATTLRARIDVPLWELPALDALDPASLDAWLDAHPLDALLGALPRAVPDAPAAGVPRGGPTGH